MYIFCRDELLSAGKNGNYLEGEPVGFIYYPIFEGLDGNETEPVGVTMATVYWK